MMNFSQSSLLSLSEGCPTYGARSKLYNDPIHGYIRLNDDVLKFMDTRQFQRLRDLKQLGITCFVYPGAVHDRFQHCVGVQHLSANMLDHLLASQPGLDVTKTEKTAVSIAGLCHDLGHGPFSHVFDGEFIPRRRPGFTWSHEDMSLKLFDWMIDDNNIDVFDDTDGQRMVKDMIMGAKGASRKGDEKAFLYDIVANGKNSIDTDKFDYLARDVYYVGLRSTFDFRRLMLQSRVIHGEICYHAKEVYNVLELFHTRYTLFKQCYIHRASKSVEYMITDALCEADVVWDGRLSKAVDDVEEYTKLTDYVLKEIEISSDPALRRAQDIIAQLRRRLLYKFVDEYIMSTDAAKMIPKVTAEDISTNNVNPSISIVPSDVIVHDHKLNYGNKDHSPLDSTMFFNDTQGTSFYVNPDKVSYILPGTFEERIVRVYSRSREPEKVRAIQKAFRAFLRKFQSNVSTSPAPCVKSPEHTSKRDRLFLSQLDERPYRTEHDVLDLIASSAPAASSPNRHDGILQKRKKQSSLFAWASDIKHNNDSHPPVDDDASDDEPPQERKKHALQMPPLPKRQNPVTKRKRT